MSDTYAEPTDELDVAANYEPGQDPEGTEAPTWSGPSQAEWEQLRDTIGWLHRGVQQSYADRQAAAEAERRAELEELVYTDPERYVNELLGERLAPIQAYMEEHAAQAAIADAEDAAFGFLADHEIAEGEQEAVRDVAEYYIDGAIASAGVGDVHELAKLVASRTGESYDDARQRIGYSALAHAVEQHRRSKASVGADEVQLAHLMTSGAPARNVGPARGRDEMSLVAAYARGEGR